MKTFIGADLLGVSLLVLVSYVKYEMVAVWQIPVIYFAFISFFSIGLVIFTDGIRGK